MKVGELIEILQDCDEDAEVLIGSQQQWPFDYDVYGVVIRSDFESAPDDEDCNESGDVASRQPKERTDGTSPNDVLILEGNQLRYGDKNAWNAAGR